MLTKLKIIHFIIPLQFIYIVRARFIITIYAFHKERTYDFYDLVSKYFLSMPILASAQQADDVESALA